jgi:signal transduction histidine kinase
MRYFSPLFKFRYSLDYHLVEHKLSCNFFLFTRVLINMVKNAVEVSKQGGEIRIGATLGDDSMLFTVWNAGRI